MMRFLHAVCGRGPISRGVRLARDLLYLAILIVLLAVVFAALYHCEPTLLVATSSGLQTMFQVLAASLVGVVVLLLGSIFLITQHVSSTLGPGAAKAILLANRVRFIFAAALLLSLGTLLVSGQIPRNPADSPDRWITAAGSTLTLSSAVLIFGSAIALATLSHAATSWGDFMDSLVENAKRCPDGPADHHMSIACEGLMIAARAQDGYRMRRALRAISGIVAEHLRHEGQRRAASAGEATPAATPEWTNRLSWTLLRAGEEALRGGALWRDLDKIGQAFMERIRDLLDAGMADEAMVFVDALAQLAAVGQQLDEHSPLRRAWLPDRCATALARIHADSERHGPVAERALVGWALACIAVDGDKPKGGPLYQKGLIALGPNRPRENVRTLVERVVYTRDPLREMWRWGVTSADRRQLIDDAVELLETLPPASAAQ